MRALLSTIGSRGDVQPLVALAMELRALGHEARLCVPPDFREWIEELGFPVTAVGPELRATGKADPAAPPPSAAQRRQMIEATVAAQFGTIAAAVDGCDVIVGATALQIAAASIAERSGVPYVFVAYCPAVLPSRHHAPPVLTSAGDTVTTLPDYSELWAHDAVRWNALWRDPLNAHRTRLGLAAIDDVRRYVLTDRPWLAADRLLAPWPGDDDAVFQSGAWLVDDDRPLSPEVEAFLDAGDPPIYFGFGSIRAPQGLGESMVASARAIGRRAVVLRGWAELSVDESSGDCLVIGEVNQQALFRRVAAVVHHGGAGTTTAAARAGAPQVVMPQVYDQHYWAERVERLGIGVAHRQPSPTVGSMTEALQQVRGAGVIARAQTIGREVRSDGARTAAERLTEMLSGAT